MASKPRTWLEVVGEVARYLGAVSLLMVAAIHALQYNDAYFSAVPTIRRLFMLNTIGASVTALLLLAPLRLLGRRAGDATLVPAALAGIGVAAGAFTAMPAQGDERPLPQGMFDRAMREHVEMIKVRVRGLYVRSRALFAEAVVAALVDGTIVEFPAAAWDVEMPLPDLSQPVRIQVKCSGERAPQSPEKIRPPYWGSLKAPLSAKDPRFGVLLAGKPTGLKRRVAEAAGFGDAAAP